MNKVTLHPLRFGQIKHTIILHTDSESQEEAMTDNVSIRTDNCDEDFCTKKKQVDFW